MVAVDAVHRDAVAAVEHGVVVERSVDLEAVHRPPEKRRGIDRLLPELGGVVVPVAGCRGVAPPVLCVGDVTGRQQFTHMASYHAGICLRNILFKYPAKMNETAVPWVTYCDPELAHVGLTHDDAIACWGADNVTVTRWDLADNDRARTDHRTAGMVKAIVHKNGRILGASILAPVAGEMIQPWILAIASKQKIASMATMIAPYPTYGEASKRAAGNFFTAKLFGKTTQKLVRFLLRF